MKQVTRARASVAIASVLLAVPSAAAAAGKPDVRATSLKSPRVALSVLGGSATSSAVGNASAVAAKKLVVSIVLSTDRRRDGRDVVIGTATLKGLKGRAKRTLGISLLVPGAVKPGSYWLVACVTAGAQKQASTRNDCVSTARKVTVGAPAATVTPTIATVEPSAVSKVIGPAGGSISVAGPIGGSTVLTIPAKALSVPTTIRLVPVASVAPGPRGVSPVTSVIAEPEGLAVSGATIAFTLPAGLPATGLGGMAFGGEDEAIVRAPLLRGAGLRLDASILGGYGVGIATPGLPFASGGKPRRAGACSAESLRKRADAIAAAANPRTTDEYVSMTEALVRFEGTDVLPALRAAARGGASADDLAPFIELAVLIERQAALLGVHTPNNVIVEATNLLRQAGASEIKKCADRTQGPATTLVNVRRIVRNIALVGGGEDSGLETKVENDCLSKPYLLTYEMTTTEHFTVNPAPPAFVGGTGVITDLPVLFPLSAAAAIPARGPMTFNGLTCEPGSAYISCAVDSANGELEAAVLGVDGKLKPVTRCGRTVNEPAYEVVFQLRQLTEEQHMTVMFQPPTGNPIPLALLGGGAFDRAMSQATDEMQQVTLPDNGGSEFLIGSTGNFHGSFLAIEATGNATLKLK
jgi:hypothetical protein